MLKHHRDRCEDAVAKLIKTYSDAADLQDRITALGNSGKILPETGEEPYDYLERLYHIAKVDLLREQMEWERMQKEYNHGREYLRAIRQSTFHGLHGHFFDDVVTLGATGSQPLHPGSANLKPGPAKQGVPPVERPKRRMLKLKKKG